MPKTKDQKRLEAAERQEIHSCLARTGSVHNRLNDLLCLRARMKNLDPAILEEISSLQGRVERAREKSAEMQSANRS